MANMKNRRMTISVLVMLCLLFAQIAPAAAANAYSDPGNTQSGNNAQQFTNDSNTAVRTAADSLGNYYLTQYRNESGWNWLKTTNISFNAFSGNTPQWNINTFQPLTMGDRLDNFLFAQGQYGTVNNTVNVGLGYRTMDDAHSSMYGINLFYDLQPSVQGENGYSASGSLMRVGAGLEYFTGSIETRLNGYYGVGSDVQVGGLQTSGVEAGTIARQHVAPGMDLSIGTDFSGWNAPWLKLTATGSWYQSTQSGSINGYVGSPLYANLSASMQITPQLSVSGGGSFGNGAPSNANIGFQFNLLAPPQPALLLADPVINKGAQTDISYKMLQPVQRSNTLTVERYTQQVTDPGTTATVTVRNPDGGLVAGATVTLSTPPAAAAAVATAVAPAVTNDNGVAVLQNVPLSSTPYTMTISRSGYSDQSQSITINSANPTAQVNNYTPSANYTVNITVQDTSGNAVSGAAVRLGSGTATTDANGLASFQCGAANYPVSITKDGYSFNATTLAVSQAVNKTYQMSRASTIMLNVFDSSTPGNTAVANAIVRLGDYAAVLTDSEGIATITNVADGRYGVDIVANGYAKLQSNVVVADGNPAPVAFGLTKVSKPNVYVTVTGLAASDNVASYTVKQWSGSSVVWSQSYSNLGNGTTTVQLPASYVGTYSVTVNTVSGYTYSIENPTFTVDSTSQFVNINYSSDSGATINGAVVDSMDGLGVGGVIVRLYQSDEKINETTTAANGSYSFTGITPGTYVVALLNSSGYAVTVAAGQTYTAANMTVLKPRVTIVTSGLADGVQATVTLTDFYDMTQNITVSNGTTGPTLMTYGEGRYDVTATASGYTATITPDQIVGSFFAKAPKTVTVVFKHN